MIRWRGVLAALALVFASALSTAAVDAPLPTHEIVRAQVTTAAGTRAVTLPHVLSPRDFAPDGQAVTYRMTVWWDVLPQERIGIALDKVSLAGRLQVNGHDLGACAPGDLERLRCLHQPQWWHTSPDLWRAGSNEIVVQVWANAQQVNGLSTLVVGPAKQVYAQHHQPRKFWQHEVALAILWASLLLGAMALGIGATLKGHRLYLWFGLAALVRALSGLSLQVVHMEGSVFWTTWAIISVRLVALPITILAVLAFFERLDPRMERVLIAIAVAMPVVLALAGNDVQTALMLAVPVTLLAIGLIVRVIGWTWKSRRPRDVMLTLTVLLLLLAGIHDVTVYRGIQFTPVLLTPYSSGVVLLVMGGMLLVRLILALRTHANLNTILAHKVAVHEADLQRKHQTILDLERLNARTHERERFLRDLHDGLGSSLSAARIRLDDDDLSRQEVGRLLDECIDDMRLLLATSAPDAQLADALGELRYRLDRRLAGVHFKLAWRIDLEGMPTMPAAVRLQLMRIVQEAINNALRHAGMTLVTIAATYDAPASLLQISIDDDGRNLEATPSSNAHTRGVQNQQHRARRIGAELQVVSGPQGTRVSVQWRPATAPSDTLASSLASPH